MPNQDTELKAQEEMTQEANANSQETETSAQGGSVSGAEFEKLRAEYEQVKSERDQLVDRTARLQAEFENARKRAERERQDFKRLCHGQCR